MIDVTLAIMAEAVPVTWRTRGPSTYDSGGNAVLGAVSESTILATVQPNSGRILRDRAEGVHRDITHVVWTKAEVKVDDEIIYQGDTLRVHHVWPRRQDNFTRAAVGGAS